VTTRYKPGSRIKSPASTRVYELGDRLGEGGFGVVYGAHAVYGPPAGTDLCIKFTEDQTSWHREALFGELLAGNDRAIHVIESFPRVARERGSHRVEYCLVLELAKHGSLADWLETEPKAWSEAKVKHEMAGLLRVLDQLHGGGVLHRDVTPFNVFVCQGERLKLGDFGIAQLKLGRKKGIPADLFNIMWSPHGFADGDQHRWLATDDIYQMGQLLAVLVRGDASEPITTKSVRTLGCCDALKAVIRRAVGQRDERYRDALEMIAAIETPLQVSTGGVSSLRGKRVVFTGPLSVARAQAAQWVRRVGGKVESKVTAQIDVLIRGNQSPIWIAGDKGMKLLAAQRLQERGKQIRVINEGQFRRLVRRRSVR
jgi:serine/threonine protein kinase